MARKITDDLEATPERFGTIAEDWKWGSGGLTVGLAACHPRPRWQGTAVTP